MILDTCLWILAEDPFSIGDEIRNPFSLSSIVKPRWFVRTGPVRRSKFMLTTLVTCVNKALTSNHGKFVLIGKGFTIEVLRFCPETNALISKRFFKRFSKKSG